MTARDEVVTALRAVLPAEVIVLAYARDIDPPTKPTVMVRIDEVRPSAAPQAFRQYTFAVLVIASQTVSGPADDELDALLEDVLFAIDSSGLLTWQQATRATFEDKFPAYQVDLLVTITKER